MKFTSLPPTWQSSLVAGNPQFRRNGTYDAPPDTRRLRRILERQAKKEARRNAKN